MGGFAGFQDQIPARYNEPQYQGWNMTPTLIVLEGPNRGTVLTVRPGENRIGRELGLEIRLPDSRISRRHAILTFDADRRFILSDLGSRNATYLNGIRVTSSYRLSHGDEIRLGDSLLMFLCETEVDAVDRTGGLSETAPVSSREVAAQGLPPSDTSRLVSQRYSCMVGESEAFRRVCDLIARCASADTTVLIVGETGTGKELAAEALHRLSQRRSEPFVVVNCATLEPDLLESDLFGHEPGAFPDAVSRRLGKLGIVGSGTLFLDEVGELSLEAQAKLLRAIDRREYERAGGQDLLTTNARFVAATQRDLQQLVRDQRFREDLLFRLRGIEISIPPLRERPEDIEPLVVHFADELLSRMPARARSFAPEALACLGRHSFPGNVRELRNVVESCLILARGEEVQVADLTPAVRGGEAVPTPVEDGETERTVVPLAELERDQIVRALKVAAGNKAKAARLLGIERATLYSKIKRHGLSS
ncbi:sigma 54-interacting transcriptional regulator [Planctomycetota bacterium]